MCWSYNAGPNAKHTFGVLGYNVCDLCYCILHSGVYNESAWHDTHGHPEIQTELDEKQAGHVWKCMSDAHHFNHSSYFNQAIILLYLTMFNMLYMVFTVHQIIILIKD